MSRLAGRFAEGKLLIPYVVAGFPTLETSRLVIERLRDAGCSVIEIGIPYSDPLADGPTIQRASEAALGNEIRTDDVFDMIARLDKERLSPVLMVYYNLIYRYGLDRFAGDAAAAGVEGVIVPDLTVEESETWVRAARSQDIDTIFLVAPTSSERRVDTIAKLSTGFVYCVSLTGVTGARAELPTELTDFVRHVKAQASAPVAVGFGISTAEQAKGLVEVADGVIVGSAFVDLIEQSSNGQSAADRVADFAGEILTAIR